MEEDDLNPNYSGRGVEFVDMRDWRREKKSPWWTWSSEKSWTDWVQYMNWDSGQTPFHYSWDESECVGAHMLVFITIMSFVCLWAWMWYLCITLCVCTCVLFGCVRIVCSGGWAPPLWQLPAAEGLERWHCWNGADLFVNVSVFVLFCGCISNESHESWVCHKSERELDQIKGNPAARLTPIPAREEKNYRMGKLQFKGKKHRRCLDERREERDEL